MTSGPPFALPPFAPGSVWLVGAGPGDPGLLTLAAAHALAHADAIVYDALIDDSVLALAPATAVREFVGKRGGRPSPRQSEITARLVELAGQGLRVLRLKGGDPFVFGRGAEEALALAAAGIPFRIVPGVTAGIGGLAYAGIPATSRDTNSAVAFVTGHDASGGLPDDIDWPALARGAPVIVLYMAMRQLAALAAVLTGAGRRPDEPVAVVSRATTAGQRVVQGTLATIADRVRAAGVGAPAVIVVGEVVRLRDRLAWVPGDVAAALDPPPDGATSEA